MAFELKLPFTQANSDVTYCFFTCPIYSPVKWSLNMSYVLQIRFLKIGFYWYYPYTLSVK